MINIDKIVRDRIQEGFFTDIYFLWARELLKQSQKIEEKEVTIQIFQKNEGILSGIDEAIEILRTGTGCFDKNGEFINCWEEIEVMALPEGSGIKPFETVMTIKGPYSYFAHLETLYLGVLARGTKIATNVKNIVNVANGKSISFFPARHAPYYLQPGDGWAAYIGGVTSVSTAAQATRSGLPVLGTMPHSLIAAHNGNTVDAAIEFAIWSKKQVPEIDVIVLVDFDNDCVQTSLEVAKELGRDLYGVRLDTSNTMVDKSLWRKMSQFNPNGVNPELVKNVREALDKNGYPWVKIFVSGGFNRKRVESFENNKVPVDGYGIGSTFFSGNFDYTADVVIVDGKILAKEGRKYNPNPRLVKLN